MSVSQRYALITALRNDEGLQKHFDLTDLEDRAKKITLGQRQYILALIFNSKRQDLHRLLISLGFKQKTL